MIRDDDGPPRFYTAQIENVSERHIAELRFRSAFDDAAVGMALGERRGHDVVLIVEVNAATSRILGRSRDELVGSPSHHVNKSHEMAPSRPARMTQ